jgi:hypothetical protein
LIHGRCLQQSAEIADILRMAFLLLFFETQYRKGFRGISASKKMVQPIFYCYANYQGIGNKMAVPGYRY